MVFEIHTLNTALIPFIESIFYFDQFKPAHSIERVVPTGHIFILFELDDIPRNTFDNESLKPNATFTKAWVSGMHKNYLSISAHQNSEMLVIQFKPYGGFPFFHQAIDQYNDQVIPAKNVFGENILKLRDAIKNKKDFKQKFELAENWLMSKLDQRLAPTEDLLKIVAGLQQHPISSYKNIIEAYPKTQKHLIDQFKKYCGLTPKTFHRILRFNEILQQIHQQKEISWSQIAYQCGYTDQSHFIKEFKAFSGFNPQEFIKRAFNQSEPNFFPLDGEG